MEEDTQNKDLDPVGVRGFKSHPPHFYRNLRFLSLPSRRGFGKVH